MFNVGQKVVCIEGKLENGKVVLVEQHIYTVRNISGCRCHALVDVGRTTPSVKCYKCNTFISSDGTWWFYATRFIPLDEWQKANENVQQLMEEIQDPILECQANT